MDGLASVLVIVAVIGSVVVVDLVVSSSRRRSGARHTVQPETAVIVSMLDGVPPDTLLTAVGPEPAVFKCDDCWLCRREVLVDLACLTVDVRLPQAAVLADCPGCQQTVLTNVADEVAGGLLRLGARHVELQDADVRAVLRGRRENNQRE